MTRPTRSPVYVDIEITATSPRTGIWLGDCRGFLVQKEVGVLRSSLLRGNYVVEFGLGTTCYPIRLRKNSRYSQSELKQGPSCPRPVPKLPPQKRRSSSKEDAKVLRLAKAGWKTITVDDFLDLHDESPRRGARKRVSRR